MHVYPLYSRTYILLSSILLSLLKVLEGDFYKLWQLLLVVPNDYNMGLDDGMPLSFLEPLAVPVLDGWCPVT